jgi:glutamyl-tRNA reductase
MSRSSRPEFVVVGLDHRTANIELRERVAFGDAAIPAALEQATDPADQLLEQAAILSTCNRVELYGVARSRPRLKPLAAFLARQHGLEPDELTGALYAHRGDDVAHHLAATAAGMRSLVLGEAQIQGQVRTALQYSLWSGSAGPELRRLFESAIAAGRRVRSNTNIGRGVASVPHAAVEFARQRLGTLTRSTALLIGAGTTADLASKHLVKQRPRELLVFGRDPTRADRLAQRCGGHVIGPDRLGDALARSDLVISSTAAPGPVLHRDQLQRATANRGADSAPLLLIDLAVPRDIDPAAARLPGIELHTIDDLREVVQRTLAQRSAELPAAHAILQTEVERFTAWLHRREMRRCSGPWPPRWPPTQEVPSTALPC